MVHPPSCCGCPIPASSSSSARPAAGKSTGPREWFAPEQIVSSDRLRAVVGTGERDQRASGDAFEVLELIVAKRLRRRLTTVIDSTGLERQAPRRVAGAGRAPRRAGLRRRLRRARRRTVRARNRARGDARCRRRSSPASCARRPGIAERARRRGLRRRARAGPVALVPPAFLTAPAGAPASRRTRCRCEFGLQVSRFDFPGHPATTAASSPTSRAPPRRPASRACG